MDNIIPPKKSVQAISPINPPNTVESNISADEFFSMDSLAKERASEQEKILKKQNLKEKLVFVLKNSSISIFVLTLFSFFWLTADLEPRNEYLSSVDIENVGIRFQVQNEKFFLLDTKFMTTVGAIQNFKNKIKNKKFLRYQKQIDEINAEQLVWFDRREGENYLFGMMDIFQRMGTFFNDRRYTDPQKIVSGRKDQLKISDVSVNRDGASLSVEVSQILGRVFFLTNEFIDIVNSIPFYQGADIKSFTRDKNDLGDDSMRFSINLKRQENPNRESQIPHPEVDSADVRFYEFSEWFNNVNK